MARKRAPLLRRLACRGASPAEGGGDFHDANGVRGADERAMRVAPNTGTALWGGLGEPRQDRSRPIAPPANAATIHVRQREPCLRTSLARLDVEASVVVGNEEPF